jgi:hypothetical protein
MTTGDAVDSAVSERSAGSDAAVNEWMHNDCKSRVNKKKGVLRESVELAY